MNLQTKSMHVLLVVISIFFYQSMNLSTAAAQITLRDYYEFTAAVSLGNVQTVQSFLDKKIDIHRTSEDHPINSVQLALHSNRYAIADLLFAAGGDVNCPLFFSKDESSPSYFQWRIIGGDLKKVLYCIKRDKRCIDCINKKVIVDKVKGKLSSLVVWVTSIKEEDASQAAEFLQAILSYNPSLDDSAIETEDTKHALFDKTVERVIRERSTPAMVAILDKHIASLREQGGRGMQQEFGGLMFNEQALEGVLGHFAEFKVLTDYVKSRE